MDTQGFCYDEQDRLIWAATTGSPPAGCTLSQTPQSMLSVYQASYTYDNLGRLNSGPLGSYSYGSSSPPHLHAATSIGSTWTARYDQAGNMTCRAPTSATTCAGTQTGAQLGYSAAGSLSSWASAPSAPASSASLLYDGQGNRVAQQVTQSGTATTTIYVGSLEELVTSGATTSTQTYYYANGNRFAMAVNGTFSYLAGDQLGSVNTAVQAIGWSQSTALYDPYGGVRYSTGTMPTDYGFTGQHADASTGLDYYNARYYDPMAGQFASADSILPGNGYDVFGLSRYAYVEGNPVIRTDPSGRSTVLCDSPCPRSDSPPPDRVAPGLREDPRTPGTKTLNPCAYGMEDARCDADLGNRLGYYTGMGPEEWRCIHDPACSQGVRDVAPLGLFFLPGPDAIFGFLGLGRGLAFIGERLGFVGKVFRAAAERAGGRAIERASIPKPPGFNKDWQLGEASRQGVNEKHWWDPRGGEWRWHPADQWHPNGHWDYNPWNTWNSPWQQVYP